ncbi:MAG: CpaE family protein [Vicinamibacterales bacterium]|jgi:pilus assembly protein CpaE
MIQADTSASPTIVLIGSEPELIDSIAATLGPVRSVAAVVVHEAIENAVRRPELERASVIVVDLDSRRRESLLALQGLTTRLGLAIPVIVLTEGFDDALARWFMQIRVADFLRKPVDPKEVLRACIRVLRGAVEGPGGGGEILSFLSAAGGVGATALAIEAAMLLLRDCKETDTTCLVDLDWQNSACADYLDLEPRLDLDEIMIAPERLDAQLLEVMLSRHKCGLSLIATKSRPTQANFLDPAFVLRLLDLVSARFERVIIDLPRSWEPWTDQVLLGSSRVFVVTDMTVPGLRAGRRWASAIAARLPDVKPKIIVNRFEQQLLFGTGLRRVDVERALEGFLAGTVSNNYKLVREAIDRGLPLEEIKAGSNVSNDLRKIVFSQSAAELRPSTPTSLSNVA